ncbi:LysR family transcriptional regulator [Microbacterium marmarense]|uniref:LysR family transcriptional regulator n=1 Tax=Microbacterium marmarense TaxID=3122051 RepID=A0ABU8LQW0_9MICO
MELSWARSFVAVHELGGFGIAARSLHRSQSRVSAHIASLEMHVGEQLFFRDVHPPALTPAGLAFLPHARAALAEWQAAVAAVAAGHGQVHGEVSIGSVPSVSAVFIAPLIARFRVLHPQVSFAVHEGPYTWLSEALAHRTIELSITPVSGERPLGIEQRVLLTDPFNAVVPRDHPLARRGELVLNDLAGQPVITTGEAGLDARVGGEFRRMLDDADIDRERSFAVTQPTSVYALVRAGLGIGVLGSLASRIVQDDETVVLPIRAKHASRRIALCWASTRRMSPAAAAFVAELDQMIGAEITEERLWPA